MSRPELGLELRPESGLESLPDRIVALLNEGGGAVEALTQGEGGWLVAAATPFYGESGGQVGDTGAIASTRANVKVTGAQRPVPGLVTHVGEVTVVARHGDLLEVCRTLRDHTELKFEQLIDLCGVDYPEREERFEAVYHLYSVRHGHRIRLKVPVGAGIPRFLKVGPTNVLVGLEDVMANNLKISQLDRALREPGLVQLIDVFSTFGVPATFPGFVDLKAKANRIYFATHTISLSYGSRSRRITVTEYEEAVGIAKKMGLRMADGG